MEDRSSASRWPPSRRTASCWQAARMPRFIYRCSGNAYLQETLERYLSLSLRIWYLVLDRLPHLFDRVHEHRDLLVAIRERDAERARRIAGEHVATFEGEIRGVL